MKCIFTLESPLQEWIEKKEDLAFLWQQQDLLGFLQEKCDL